MRVRTGIITIIVLTLLGIGVVSAQDGTTVPTPPPAGVTVQYGDFRYELDAADGTVAIGFVEERTITTEGTTIEVVLFAHDETGWRAVGLVTGEATGPLTGAAPGQVLTLSIVGDDQ